MNIAQWAETSWDGWYREAVDEADRQKPRRHGRPQEDDDEWCAALVAACQNDAQREWVGTAIALTYGHVPDLRALAHDHDTLANLLERARERRTMDVGEALVIITNLKAELARIPARIYANQKWVGELSNEITWITTALAGRQR